MTNPAMNDPSQSGRLDEILALYLESERSGHALDRQRLLAENADLADELRAFFVDHDRMKAVAEPLRVAEGARSEAAAEATQMHHGDVVSAPDEPGLRSPQADLLAGQHWNISPARPGSVIRYFGDYELLSEIARGGMGVVYRARQVNLDRIVALKMILAGQLASDEDVRRFYQEAEAAANLEHRGIVPVFEVGQHENQHFFSMAFVEGPNLAQVLIDGPLPPKDAATIVRLVAEAIAYAHSRGVIHRDLKPANILLARIAGDNSHQHLRTGRLQDNLIGVRGQFYQPKVTDFGLAKRTEAGAVGMTGTGQILGTPSYMPPEQASGRISDTGAVSDVYSLGAILYAALTGHPPFQSDTPLNIVMQVLEQEPVSPRQSNPAVPRDLETICLKCLEKDRRKRYSTARELADELQRYSNGEPIRARRISGAERAWRWCRRKPALAGLWGMCLLVLLLLSIGGPWLALNEREIARTQQKLRQAADDARIDATRKQNEADKHRSLAENERLRARQNLVASQLLLGQIARDDGDLARSLAWYLQVYLNSPEGDRIRQSGRNLLGAWGGAVEQTLVHDSEIHVLAVSPNGRTLLAGYLGCQSQLWDRAAGKPVGEPQTHSGDLVSAEISPDGRFALTSDWDGAHVWETSTGKLRFPKLDHVVREDTVVGPVLSPDGRTIVTRSTLEEIRLWDAETGKPRCASLKHGHFVDRMLFSPDSTLVVSFGDNVARLWNAETGEPVADTLTEIADIAFHPESQVVATCGSGKEGKVLLREALTGRQVAELSYEGPLRNVIFDSTGRHLLATADEKACLWRNAADAESARQELPHNRGLFTAAFSPNGRFVLTAGPSLLKLWTVQDGKLAWERTMAGDFVTGQGLLLKSSVFSPDSRSLLINSQNGTAEVLSLNRGQMILREEKVHQATLTSDGATFVAASTQGWVRFRPVPPSMPKLLPISQFPNQGRGISAVSFSPDGQFVCAIHDKNVAQVCNAKTFEPIGDPLVHDLPVAAAAFSPDSRTLVTSVTGKSASPFITPPGQVHFWDVVTRKPIGEPVALGRTPYTLSFDRTGRTVHLSESLCDVTTHKLIPFKPAGESDQPPAAASLVHWWNSPLPLLPPLRDAKTDELTRVQLPVVSENSVLMKDGRRLLTVQRHGIVRMWDAPSGKPLGPEFQASGYPRERTADGCYVLFGDLRTLQIWDPFTGRPCGEPMLDESANVYASFNPSGDKLATLWHFTARLWDSATGQALSRPITQSSNGGTAVLFSPDGQHLLVLCSGVQRWQVPLPAADEPQRLQLSVEVRTGLRVDENGTLQKLSQAEWLKRKQQLESLGGPCDFRSEERTTNDE